MARPAPSLNPAPPADDYAGEGGRYLLDPATGVHTRGEAPNP